MAEPSDIVGEVSTALERSGRKTGAPGAERAGKEINRARRIEALSMRLAGLPTTTIAERLNVTEGRVSVLINNLLTEAENRTVGEMRTLENARLDRAQAAIWTKVLEGDIKAVGAFLRISEHRARMNGLNAPQQVDLSVSVRQEMEEALTELQSMLEGEVIEDAEVEEVDDEPSDQPG